MCSQIQTSRWIMDNYSARVLVSRLFVSAPISGLVRKYTGGVVLDQGVKKVVNSYSTYPYAYPLDFNVQGEFCWCDTAPYVEHPVGHNEEEGVG